MSPNDPHRLSDLLGARVVTTAGEAIGYVNDVRLQQPGSPADRVEGMVVVGIIVSGRHAGSMLGYDRHDRHGPWLVRTIVRALHRNARYIPWTAVKDSSWEQRRVTVAVEGVSEPALSRRPPPSA
jgi:sporulation protein YlmC with PRC-barrel domain